LLLSDSEGLSNAALEGLAAGVPMICTAVGGNLELIKDGVNGFLVPCRDETSVANALEALRSDPERRRRMGEGARRSLIDRAEMDKVADSYIRLYRDLGAHADV
jgi:glycosyltransferase involved in cell wall biosynthesis